MDVQTMERARGCMVAAGLFFRKGNEDIAQAIELGLRTDDDPAELYDFCLKRDSADPSVLAACSLIIFFMVRDGLQVKKACFKAWETADQVKDGIVQAVSSGMIAAEKPRQRGKLLVSFEADNSLRGDLSLAIYLSLLKRGESFAARLAAIRKLKRRNAQIMAAAFAGALCGLQEVNSAAFPNAGQ